MVKLFRQNKSIFLIAISIVVIIYVLIYMLFHLDESKFTEEEDVNWIPYARDTLTYDKFLIYNKKCRMPDLSPWNRDATAFYAKKEHTECSNKPLLSSIQKINGRVFLTINKTAKKHYCSDEVFCCYSIVTRPSTSWNKQGPDDYVKTSPCENFKNKVEIQNDVVKVSCSCGSAFWSKEVYANTHAVTILTKELRNKKNKFGNIKPPSILFVGIDSISRLNFIRTMPQTHNYMLSKDWISYKGYNKVGLNTFPNLVSILTGHNLKSAMNISNPHKSYVDKYDLIWKDFQKLGYVTAYAEDVADINTFNYNKKGFYNKPTDLYFRHYSVATDKLPAKWEDGVLYCAGPEVYGERIFNMAKDFSLTFIDQPTFGFFWSSSFSHDEVNAPMKLDNKLREFFEDLEKNGIMNNSIIIFLSDHGIRFGDIRLTLTGWIEERLPFLYFWIPTSFRDVHQIAYENLKNNSNKLTTPFDLYVTLHDILSLSGLNHTVKKSVSCPKCHSLFKEIEEIRSCEEAAIDIDWCTCISYKHFNSADPLVMDIANFVIKETKKLMFLLSDTANRCAPLKVNKIIRARISNTQDDWYNNNTYVMVMFETAPKITLEATVLLEKRDSTIKFHLQGQVSRIDLYKYTGSCVDIEELKRYCYCKWNSNYISFISAWLKT